MDKPTEDIISISCNWKVSNRRDIKSCLSLIAPKQDVEFEELVTLDSCVAFSRGELDPTELPEISLKLKVPGVAITDIYVVSEARTLELYLGQSQHYDGTTRGLDSEAGDDELRVYNAKLRLNPPSNECSIRFAGIGKGDMWLLGLGVAVKPVSVEQQSLSMVQQMLEGSNLSPGAEQCRRMVLTQGAKIPEVSTSAMRELEDRVMQRIDQLEARLISHVDQRINELKSTITTHLNLKDNS